mmetsp:Transcript_18499/g.22429  ORF Transcript_18499/g.22429 Transcript_18499/m.22429 type:complete len:90 (+) Transcript_18499:1674-1943(+)
MIVLLLHSLVSKNLQNFDDFDYDEMAKVQFFFVNDVTTPAKLRKRVGFFSGGFEVGVGGGGGTEELSDVGETIRSVSIFCSSCSIIGNC